MATLHTTSAAKTVDRIIDDLRNGYITPKIAKDKYGVTVDKKTFKLIELSQERKIAK